MRETWAVRFNENIDLTGKCGSCKWASAPIKRTPKGAPSYIECLNENERKRHKKPQQNIKQRTADATGRKCYEPRKED